MIQKIKLTILVFGLLLSCIGCNKEEKVQKQQIEESQMQSICELAVMECYYHNVAKFFQEDATGFWIFTKDKHFWIEYSGVARVGLDANLVTMKVENNVVTITVPQAKVLDCKVDEASLTKDSFIVDERSAKITAEDEQMAFVEAQKKMEEEVSTDETILSNAQRRAKNMLEKYVENVGDLLEQEYTIVWIEVDENGDVINR